MVILFLLLQWIKKTLNWQIQKWMLCLCSGNLGFRLVIHKHKQWMLFENWHKYQIVHKFQCKLTFIRQIGCDAMSVIISNDIYCWFESKMLNLLFNLKNLLFLFLFFEFRIFLCALQFLVHLKKYFYYHLWMKE